MNEPNPTSQATIAAPALKRSLGLPMLVLYGLGVTVGAGIYALIGVAAARAGSHAPLSFLIAAAVMALTAASLAELAGRMPVSAGEAAYVREGFGSDRAALLVGLLVVAAGLVSAAAISRGAAGYVGELVRAPQFILVAIVVLAMGVVAALGVREAVGFAAIMTLIEVGGLLTVIAAGFWRDPALLLKAPEAVHGLASTAAWSGVLGAALIAFFAFIGFEGIVNVAEEAEEPARTIPRAILATMVLTTLLYILVVWVAIHSVPRAELAASPAPLSLVFQRVAGLSPGAISAIAVVATINGIIVQLVMTSRVLYGLAGQGSLPAWLGAIHPATHTPLAATAVSVGLVLVLALALPIDWLADMTTRVMLVIFAAVNLALVRIKQRRQPVAAGVLVVPIAVPLSGFLSCLGLLVANLLL